MAEKSIKRNAILNMIKTIMSLLFPLITFPYASRILLPEGIGRVNFANSIVSYFAMIAALGITSYGIRESAKVRNDKSLLNKFSQEIFTINIMATAIAYLLFFIAIFVVPQLYEYRTLLLICGSSILFTTLGMDWLYGGLEEYAYITVRSICFQFLSMILLFVFVKNEADYEKYALIGVVSNVGSNILNFIHSRKFISLRRTEKLELKKHLKPVLVIFSMAMAGSVYLALDSTMLGFVVGDKEVGIYTAATKLTKMIISVIASVSTVLLPRLSYYAEKENSAEFSGTFNKSLDFILCLAIPAMIGVFLLAKPIVLLLSGGNYVSAILPTKVMSPIVVLISLGSLFGGTLIAVRKEKYILYAQISAAVMNFTLNLIFIPKLGAVGAGIGTVAAETIVTAIELIVLRKSIYGKDLMKNILQYVLAGTIMTVVVMLCLCFFDTALVQILSSFAFGALCYGLMLILFRNNMVMMLLRYIKFPKMRNQ